MSNIGIKVGDKVILKDGLSMGGKYDNTVIRTVLDIYEKENEDGDKYVVISADGGEPCKTCGAVVSKPIESAYGWFELAESKVTP